MDGERGMYEWAEKWRGKVKEKEKEHNGQPSAIEQTEASLKATSPHYPCAQNEKKSRRNERFELKGRNGMGWDGMVQSQSKSSRERMMRPGMEVGTRQYCHYRQGENLLF